MWLHNTDNSALFLPSISWKVIEKLLVFCISEENSWEQEDLRKVLNGLRLRNSVTSTNISVYQTQHSMHLNN